MLVTLVGDSVTVQHTPHPVGADITRYVEFDGLVFPAAVVFLQLQREDKLISQSKFVFQQR